MPAGLLLPRAHRPSLPPQGPPPQAAGKALDTPGTRTVEYRPRYGQPDDGPLLLLLLLRRRLPPGSDLTFPGAARRRSPRRRSLPAAGSSLRPFVSDPREGGEDRHDHRAEVRSLRG